MQNDKKYKVDNAVIMAAGMSTGRRCSHTRRRKRS